MTDCTERSEGREGIPLPPRMSSSGTPVAGGPNRINSVNGLTVPQERT
jgi:hypothetical protein